MKGKTHIGIFGLITMILILMATVVLFVFILQAGLKNIENSMLRFVFPGTFQTHFEKGTYTIFHEYISEHNGVQHIVSTVPPFEMTVRQDNAKTPVKLETIKGRTRYSISGKRGRGLYSFTITEPGTYNITLNYRERSLQFPVIFTITGSFPVKMLRTIIPAVFVLLAGIFLALFIYRKQSEKNV